MNTTRQGTILTVDNLPDVGIMKYVAFEDCVLFINMELSGMSHKALSLKRNIPPVHAGVITVYQKTWDFVRPNGLFSDSLNLKADVEKMDKYMSGAGYIYTGEPEKCESL